MHPEFICYDLLDRTAWTRIEHDTAGETEGDAVPEELNLP